MREQLFSLLTLLHLSSHAQNFSSHFTGNTDIITSPIGGVVLMGGATESDEAMQWFLQRAAGGDVLVLRASGGAGYNNYLYSELGIPVNSVETIVFHNAAASQEVYVQERIQQAEAIWIAGGDQWNYVNYWRDTPVDSLINLAIGERNIVIGGTSAGMAILGGIYYTAQNSSVTSAQALQDPYNTNVTLSNEPFIQVPGLSNVITDTHYDNPDRRGRHTVFLARAITEMGVTDAIGIASEEYTAVCIDDSGIARVFGGWPAYDDHAWFIQANCMTPMVPEVLQQGTPLTWDHGQLAVKACKVAGTTTGQNTFDLNDRVTSIGGVWEDWFVVNGTLHSNPDPQAPDCTVSMAAGSVVLPRLITDAANRRYGLVLAEERQKIRLIDMQGRVLQELVYPGGIGWIDAPSYAPVILECLGKRGRVHFRLPPL